MRTLFILLITASLSYCQELEKWEKKEIPYAGEIESGDPREGGFLNAVKDVYHFLISDVDGDNCPFVPTCSSFFTEAAAEYGIVYGGFMFADRFTRDMNLFKLNKYPLSAGGRFADPPELYFYNQDAVVKALRKINLHD
ncbi:MAG TPA: membrane protein insertion efficiency factor YidD [Ignavibacteriales bacterium]|nr:membrane protein insertion efficiency factor YidD [Ignavibacteriales bacterium]